MADDEGIAQLDAVQISQDLVRLVGSVQNLESENSRLRSENQFLQNQIAILRAEALTLDTSTRFPRFSSLPLEIRRMIWLFACKVPQVQIIGYKRASPSRLNDLFDSCEESKQVILSLRLVSWQSWPSVGPSERFNFFNTYFDTLYIKGGCTPGDVTWYCGLCRLPHGNGTEDCKHRYGESSRKWCGPIDWRRYQANSPSNSPDILHSLAVPYEDMCLESSHYCDNNMHNHLACILNLLHQYRFEDLLVVMKTIKIRESSERGVSFVEPTQTPREWRRDRRNGYYNEHYDDDVPDFLSQADLTEESWPSLESQLSDSLAYYGISETPCVTQNAKLIFMQMKTEKFQAIGHLQKSNSWLQ